MDPMDSMNGMYSMYAVGDGMGGDDSMGSVGGVHSRHGVVNCMDSGHSVNSVDGVYSGCGVGSYDGSGVYGGMNGMAVDHGAGARADGAGHAADDCGVGHYGTGGVGYRSHVTGLGGSDGYGQKSGQNHELEHVD